jgi:hypothetical protein
MSRPIPLFDLMIIQLAPGAAPSLSGPDAEPDELLGRDVAVQIRLEGGVRLLHGSSGYEALAYRRCRLAPFRST